MAKKTAYVCGECGHDEPKWLGRCPSCGEWNSFSQVSIAPVKNQNTTEAQIPRLLKDIDPVPPEKHPTGNSELDRVLGGGLSPGAVVLLGGEPGIGKSTLMLQVAASLPGTGLYISGEESPGQIKTRAKRLNLPQDSLEILCETNLEILLNHLRQHPPSYVVADSVQTLISDGAASVPGSPTQIKMASHQLTGWAKSTGIPLFLVAHVTKEGIIAGPKVIEHMVDTVLYFDHSPGELRILRASKNRMGSVDEVGLFRMDSKGLHPIVDPSGLFLEHRQQGPPAGSAVTAVYEGSRILLVEIQALTVPAKGGNGRVYSDRIDQARVSRIAAVLERHAGMRLSDQDIYVNVGGGLKVTDTGAELALALALFSARSEQALPGQIVAVGELSLAGEVRPVPHLRRRLKTACETGLNRWLAACSAEHDKLPGQGTPLRHIRDALSGVLSAC